MTEIYKGNWFIFQCSKVGNALLMDTTVKVVFISNYESFKHWVVGKFGSTHTQATSTCTHAHTHTHTSTSPLKHIALTCRQLVITAPSNEASNTYQPWRDLHLKAAFSARQRQLSAHAHSTHASSCIYIWCTYVWQTVLARGLGCNFRVCGLILQSSESKVDNIFFNTCHSHILAKTRAHSFSRFFCSINRAHVHETETC